MFELRRAPQPKFTMFCVLSQNYQNFLEINESTLKQIVRETQK